MCRCHIYLTSSFFIGCGVSFALIKKTKLISSMLLSVLKIIFSSFYAFMNCLDGIYASCSSIFGTKVSSDLGRAYYQEN